METVRYNLDSIKQESTKLLYQRRLNLKLDDAYVEKTAEELHHHIINFIRIAADEL